MPSIPITDGVNLTADAELAPWSSLAQYASNLPRLVAQGADLSRWQLLTLSDPAVNSLELGLALERPMPLGNGAPAVTLGVSPAVRFGILKDQMFSPDLYGDNVAIPAGRCAVRLGFSADLSAGVSPSAGPATFGFNAAAGVEIDCYRDFDAGPGAPTVFDALRDSLTEFVVPFQVKDVAAMPAGVVATIGGSGSLKFSADAELLAIANPLATVALPAPLPGLGVKQGASVTVGASWEIAAEYQVRLQKVDSAKARIGWYRKHSSEFTVSAKASAGIAAGTSSMDLFPRIIGAISKDAHADEQELKAAALSAGDADAIESAVKKAVNRKLEIALAAEFGSLGRDEAAFLYEVDLSAADGAARDALALALRGDLSALAEPRKGIVEVRSILTRARSHGFTFKINLLGIFNFVSIAKLALKGTVTWTPSTGELLIVDQATAQRIQTASVNFGADEQKLRQVMAESFLITAAYRGSRTALAPPELKSTHSFFRLDNSTSRAEMQRFAMALQAAALPAPTLPDAPDFGRTALHLEAAYGDAATLALFLDDSGRPRSVEAYEQAGRLTLQLLIPADGDDAFRLRPITDDALWARMKDLGPANFNQIFPREQAGVISSDYLVIRWWADSMNETAALIEQILRPGAADSDALRKDLAKHLGAVTAHAKEQFGSPWGLVAMYLVSGGRAVTSGSITGARFAFSAAKPLAAAG